MHANGAPLAVPGLQAADARALMLRALGLGSAGPEPPPRVLDGRHVALLTRSDSHPSAEVFAGAALDLGARVARIVPAALGLGDTATAPGTLRVLGRLYSAIGCAGIDRRSVELLKQSCAVPVLNDLAASTHASRLLADVMTLKQVRREAAPPDAPRPRLGVYGPPRSRLLQAWLRIAPGAEIEVVDLSEAGADGRHAACDFVCRPGEPPELLALVADRRSDAPAEASLLERQRHNHRLVVQALLRSAQGSRT
jgi:hypothetical protein